jgi:hypothetical protein
LVIYAELEELHPVDRHDGNSLAVLLAEAAIARDVDLHEIEFEFSACILEPLARLVAQMAVVLGVESYGRH